MIPDVLGYPADVAISLLNDKGFQIDVVITEPPRQKPEGLQRVVKVTRKSPQQLVLTVECEETGKGGAHHGL